jgi:putative pyruvate formate lyase activating enzyme
MRSILEDCILCGHRCGVDRTRGQIGLCRAGLKLIVASSCLHRGEEPMISGEFGSGTIFFSNCCLRCAYCQNYEISQGSNGKEMGSEELVRTMLELQQQKAHNINLVSPTHFAPQIMEGLELARSGGLSLPVVYNTGGYDTLELLEQLQGKIEIYMPDLKYYDDEKAHRYSGAKNYVQTATAAIIEMFRQVGNIELDDDGVAKKGLLVRHLVLPNDQASSLEVLDFIASVSPDIWISLMAQYSPQHRAGEYPELSRCLQAEEYEKVLAHAKAIGLHNVYIQEIESSGSYLPDFTREHPFE